MSIRDHARPTTRRDRLAAHSRRLGRWVPICALLATGLAITACGSTGSVGLSISRTASGSTRASASTPILNTKKIAQAIQRSSLAQRGERAQVTCPARVYQQRGLVFSCAAAVGSSTTPFVVTELDGAGDVHYVAR